MDLIKIFLDNEWNIQIFANKWLISILIVGLFLWLLYMEYWYIIGKSFEIDKAEIGIGSQKIRIKPNYEDIQIAYKLWIELSTRKIGLPIDFENDVIIEIYNSWYEFFRLTRELIKEIPVLKIRKSESTKKLVDVAIDVLNEGMRPHLTSWQAKFRKWYSTEIEKEENKNLSPQEIQKKYSEYHRLTKEMVEVNYRLIEYRKILRLISFGEDK